MAINIFDPLVFDGLVNSANQISRPDYNPPYIESDPNEFKKFAGMAAYMKNTRKSLIVYQSAFKKSTENLISFIEKAY
jgi:hypothetical protein